MAEQPQAIPGGPGMTGHVDLEELAALIDGQCRPADAARVRAHLDSCEECFEVYSEALHLQAELRNEFLIGPWPVGVNHVAAEPVGVVAAFPFEERRKVWPGWAAAVAALLVVGVGAGLWHTRGAAPETISVADLAAPLAGKVAGLEKIAWNEVKRGPSGGKTTTTEKEAVQIGVAVLNLQVGLSSNDKAAAAAAAAQVCSMLGISGERDKDGIPIASNSKFLDDDLRMFYGGLPAKLAKGEPQDPAEAAKKAEALRHSESLEQAYFDLGAWAEAGRFAARAQTPAFFQRKDAEKVLRELQDNKDKDKEADLPFVVVKALKTIEAGGAKDKPSGDDYRTFQDAFEQILQYYYPEGHPYEPEESPGR